MVQLNNYQWCYHRTFLRGECLSVRLGARINHVMCFLPEANYTQHLTASLAQDTPVDHIILLVALISLDTRTSTIPLPRVVYTLTSLY